MSQTIGHTRTAGAAIRYGQICKLDSGLLVPCDTEGEAFYGIAQQHAEEGQPCTVALAGEAYVETASASMSNADVLTMFMTNNAGRAIPWTTGDSAVGLLVDSGYAVSSGSAATRRCMVRVYEYVEDTTA
jgi:hypothetical protein